ncbi:MAG: sensor histidine kinase [Treponema sp.]|nr:sensor histidine kinase [Treponema sp.]
MLRFFKKNQGERDFARIILMALFFLFHFMLTSRPLFYTRRYTRGESGLPSIFTLLNIAIVGFWFILELFEFLAWNYRWKKPSQGLSITVLRCLPILGILVFDPRALPGMMTLVAPLLTFYLSLVVKPFWRFCVTIFFCVVQLGLFYYTPPHAPPPSAANQYELVILLYQLMSIVLMFLFAQLWEQDRRNRDHQALLTAEITASHGELKKFASQVSRTVALEERTRIARDIHDSLGHTLTAASIQLNKAEAFFERDAAVARQAIADARSSMQEAMVDVRSTLETLNANSEGFDFFAQVTKPLESLERGGVKVARNFSGDQDGFNIAVLLALYRFIQEGATNILKHSKARNATIAIDFGESCVSAELSDDGCGFIRGAMGEKASGYGAYGLSGLVDRIALVRGEFTVDSAPGEGTTLKARMPRDPVSRIGKETGTDGH